MNQAQLNKELRDLNNQLAKKMELASTLTASSKQINHLEEENNVKELEVQIANLQREKDELANLLKSAQANVPSKLAEQRRKRLQELEHLIISLRQKISEQAQIIKMKENSDKKIVNLNSEITAMKQTKVRLIQQMKFESERFRQWKIERERELCRLRTQDRRRQNELIRLENKHNKQQIVLKRKCEQATAMNKRLKETLALQKSVQERRKQTSASNKFEKLQAWITNELDIITGTLQTEKTLEQLVEDKASIEKHLDMLKVTLNDSNMSKEDRHNILVEIQRNEEEFELRTAQITDLKQKIAESNQDIKVKAKFDSVSSLFDAKASLKHLFDICVELKKDIISKDFQLQELRDSIVEYQNKIETLEKELAEVDTNTEAQKTALEKEYAEKILLLLYQLSDKDISINTAAENTGLDVQLTQRLQIQNEQLSKLRQLRQDLEKQIDENAKLRLRLTELEQAQTSKNKSLNKRRSRSTSALNEPTEIHPTRFVELSSSEDEDTDDAKNDPDWRKTPLYKRLQQLKRRENRNLKRKSDDTRCACKSSCKKRCSCVKNSNSCSDACKCSGSCENGTMALPSASRNLSSELETSDDYNSSGAENNVNLDNTYVCDSDTTFKKPRSGRKRCCPCESVEFAGRSRSCRKKFRPGKLEELEYEVEKILALKETKTGKKYLIKWKNFPQSENTWEPEENLTCPDLLKKFFKKRQ
ncbi:unnamed protein product [Bemisia tabaci]|uniref:Chromo domain-containing protein n=1 Tax=Bemisia tabaci TaxID=7038 RepID=A0A9P0CCM3_BEMTA|nr:unnamed protein product [Bemisia tabaci]